MTYEEKGAWVYLAVSVGAYVAYVAVILARAGGTPLSEVDYVAAMLLAIGAAIVLSIVGRITVGVAQRSADFTSDARDREIDRLGEYVGGLVLGIAIVVPFGLTLAGSDHFWIANGIYAAFVLAAVAGTSVKLRAYRRGL